MGYSETWTKKLKVLMGPQTNSCPENDNGVCKVMRRTGNAPTLCGTDGMCYTDEKGVEACQGSPVHWKLMGAPRSAKYN